ncbi:hypothetical protein TNCT_132781 [Trichonephila clavata]|uniref:C2H2-type domain-containing protein n=1 Tax=Trichonephila clavata TaxID=2740835 RepID=A0A8X6GAE6_TRICU|nr:hypothetical protein TNCT_132781 [Trichonephila clavata]
MSNRSLPRFSTSTPRRHSRRPPIAHRTRRQIAYTRAIELGNCKVCYRAFASPKALWDHLRDFHASSPKRCLAITSSEPFTQKDSPLPVLRVICEEPKKETPPSPRSPYILDLVLGGYISIPDSPDFITLCEEWKDKITGSPPKPAFSPRTFAQVDSRNIQTPQTKKNTLMTCPECNKKFYTQNGLASHACKTGEQQSVSNCLKQEETKDVICETPKIKNQLQAKPLRKQRVQRRNASE